MMDKFQDTVRDFILTYGIGPNHLLINPKTHAWFKLELRSPTGVKEIGGLKVLIVSDVNIDMKAALL
jgi:hypothetical protein